MNLNSPNTIEGAFAFRARGEFVVETVIVPNTTSNRAHSGAITMANITVLINWATKQS